MLMKYYQLLCKIPTRTSLVNNLEYVQPKPINRISQYTNDFIDLEPQNGVFYYRYKENVECDIKKWYILPLNGNIILLRPAVKADQLNNNYKIYKCLLLDGFVEIVNIFEDNYTQKRIWELEVDCVLKLLPVGHKITHNNDIFLSIQNAISSHNTLMDYSIEKLSLWEEYIAWQRSMLAAKQSLSRKEVKVKNINNDTIVLSYPEKRWWKKLDIKATYALDDVYEYDEKCHPAELEFVKHVSGSDVLFNIKRNGDYYFERNNTYSLYERDIGTAVMLNRLSRNIDSLKKFDSIRAVRTLLWLYDIEHESNIPANDNSNLKFYNKNLNAEQKDAVSLILNTQDVSFILGPPGTGKTSVIAEAVYQLTKRGNSVLISSQSNDAIDNALEKLQDNPDMRIVRLTRAMDDNNQYHVNKLLSNIVSNIEKHLANKEKEGKDFVKRHKSNPKLKKISPLIKNAIDLSFGLNQPDTQMTQRKENYYTIKSFLEENGCQPENDSKFFDDGRPLTVGEIAYRINNKEHLNDSLSWYVNYQPEIKKEVDIVTAVAEKTTIIHKILSTYRKNKFDVDDDIRAFISKDKKIMDTYLHTNVPKTTNVFGITCNSDSDKLLSTMDGSLRDKIFDYVLIDEVSKATLPEILGCVLKANKVVLIGDHRQLPPVFKDEGDQSKQSEDERKKHYLYKELITNTIFKRLYDKAPDDIKCMLTKQYRMHNEIANMAISKFYVDSNNNTLLQNGLSDKDSDKMKAHNIEIASAVDDKEIITPLHHAYWIDSSIPIKNGDRIYEEHQGTSSYNTYEISIIEKLITKIDNSVSKSSENDIPSVGIISFYASQNEKLKNMISSMRKNFNSLTRVDVNTVDKFQGQERDIIIVSMVRSVEERRIPLHNNFFKAYERINVAFSRARKLLIVLGSTKFCEKQSISIPPLGSKANDDSAIINRHVYREIIDSMRKMGTVIKPIDLIGDEGEADG